MDQREIEDKIGMIENLVGLLYLNIYGRVDGALQNEARVFERSIERTLAEVAEDPTLPRVPETTTRRLQAAADFLHALDGRQPRPLPDGT